MNDQEINAAVALLKVAKCPECDGSGAYMERTGTDEFGDAVGEPRQCQWCAERDALLQAHGVSTKET